MRRGDPAAKRAGVSFSIAAFLFFLGLAPAPAAFRDPGWGVRPEGMGGAFIAVADDSNAILYNPAGSALVKRGELGFSYSRPYADLGREVEMGQFLTSYLQPINRYAGAGFAWTNYSGSHLKENSVFLNFSFNFEPMGKPFVLGANVKRMSRSFKLDERTAGDPVFASGNDKAVYALDLGAWFKPAPGFLPGMSLGLVLKNANEPNAALDGEDKAYRETAGGIAYAVGNGRLLFDASSRNGVSSYRGGGEYWFYDGKFALRGGASTLNGSLGFSYWYSFSKISLGLDYAFLLPFYIEEASTHRVSIALRR